MAFLEISTFSRAGKYRSLGVEGKGGRRKKPSSRPLFARFRFWRFRSVPNRVREMGPFNPLLERSMLAREGGSWSIWDEEKAESRKELFARFRVRSLGRGAL